jgi:protein SCO1/2
MKRRRTLIVGALLAFGSVPRASAAAPPDGDRDDSPRVSALPPAVREVDIDENLGAKLDPGLAFSDSTGRPVHLGDYLGDGRPVVLTLAYFRCPMLCGLVLRRAAAAMSKLPFSLGETYRALTVSFDPHDRPEQAAAKRASALTGLGAKAERDAWPFLVGDEPAIRALTVELGFRFAYDPKTDQYAHPAAAFVLTPDGRISRYLYGADFSPRDLRLALVEAGSGKIGSIVDRVLLTCYRFDPATHRYGPFIRGFMRLGAAMIFATVVATVFALVRAGRRRAAEDQAP